MGPNYGESDHSPMRGSAQTNVIYSEIFNKAITQDEYLNYYNNYKKLMGPEILTDFTPENVEKVLQYLNQKDELNESQSNEDTYIEEIFRELTSDGEFEIRIKKQNIHGSKLHYLTIEKDIQKTDNLFFKYKDVKGQICHLVSYLGERYYNCMIEKRWDDGKYGIDPVKYVGKDYLGKDSILTKVSVVYKEWF
jgi:hypothetical protein